MDRSETKQSFFAYLKTSYAEFVNGREKGLIGRQRLAVYLYSSMIILIGIPISLLGLTGPDGDVFFVLNGAHFLLTLALLIGYMMRRISLVWALGLLIVVTMAELSAEMLYCALNITTYYQMLIIANMVLGAIAVMLGLVAYLTYFSYMLCGVLLSTYMACALITDCASTWNFFGLFVLVFLLIALLGTRLMKNIRLLERENELLRREEYAMMEVLKLNKTQMMAFAELSKGEADDRRTAELLEQIGAEVRRKLDVSVARQLKRERMQMERLECVFHELTPSELEICQLILLDKKLTEMCAVLGKSSGNITSQRAHIREKLGLSREDNLKAALQKRMNG